MLSDIDSDSIEFDDEEEFFKTLKKENDLKNEPLDDN